MQHRFDSTEDMKAFLALYTRQQTIKQTQSNWCNLASAKQKFRVECEIIV